MEIVEQIKQAVSYTKQKEFKKAEKIYLELLKTSPENVSVLSFLGLLYFNIENYKKAEKYLEKSYKITPSKTIVSYIGLSKFVLTKFSSAIFYLEEAINEKPAFELYHALISSLVNIKDFHKAYKYSLEAHKKYPTDEKLLYNLGYSSLQIGLFKESEQYCKKLLRLNPKYPNGWFLNGLQAETLYGNEKLARESYQLMIKYGDKTGGYINLAISYAKDKKTHPKAYYYLKKIKKIMPDKKGLNFLFASYYLSNKQFKKGYKYYVNADRNSQDDIDWYSMFKHPWTGGNYKAETLFVYGDQGIGDQIQFSRYLPFLERRFKQIKVMVAEPLYELFKRSYAKYKKIKFYPNNKDFKFPRYDKSVMLASCIYYLNKGFKNIPATNGYIIADKNKTEEYKTKYFNTTNKKIGICWEAGAANLREQLHRTLNIELFEDIINLKNTNVYSFQVNPSLDNYKKYKNLINLGNTFKSFDDTSSALKNLDILITVDTSVAHLAGALGVKTYLILPYCADWRWFGNNKTTEWYDSVTIFKQTNNDSWDNVFIDILNCLSKESAKFQ